MTDFYKLPSHKQSPHIVYGVVEIPKGTSAKYEYCPDLGAFIYDRSLLSAMSYPASYGFIPNTLGDDGDALDILIYNAIPIERGTVVECRVLGVLDMVDEGKKDYKIIAVPTSHVRKYESMSDLDPLFLKVTQNFFRHYKDLNGKEVDVFGWHEKYLAKQIIGLSELSK